MKKLSKEERQSLRRLLNDAALLVQDTAKHLSSPKSCIIWLNGAEDRIAKAKEMIWELIEEAE